MARTATPSPEQIAAQVAERSARGPVTESKKTINPDNLFPTGSTLLNLACSDCIEGGPELGTIVTLPGSSSSGKTLLLLTGFADAIHRPRFDGFDFVFDDAESALAFDMAKLFGTKTAERVQPPMWDGDRPRPSKTIQDLRANLLVRTRKDKPVIYALDSLDTLSSDEELEKDFKAAIARLKDPDDQKKAAGSYHTEKAKILGETLRMINDELERTGSMLFIIQQIRQNLTAGPFGQKYITSGGMAPFFYSSHQIWLNKIGTIKAKDRKIGTETKAEVKKNKLTGKLRDCEFQIFYDMGLDDIGSMVDFMIAEKFWPKRGTTVIAEGLDIEGTRPTTTGSAGTLIEQIEDRNLERRLRRVVGQAWQEIEDSLRLGRKPRFG